MAEKLGCQLQCISYCPVLQVDLGQDSMFPDRRTTHYPIIPNHTLYQYIILGEAVVLF